MQKNNNEIVISVAEMRAADAYTIAGGVPGRELMYRAAFGVFENYDWEGKRAIVFCGGGNNGGDGYALAMILAERGHEVSIVRVSEKLSEDGAYYYEKCIEATVPMLDLNGFEQYRNESEKNAEFDVVVDCILGTGFSGQVRGGAKKAIELINDMRQAADIISVDINSGMNGDTGEAELAVISDLTVSIGFLKTGLLAGRADELIGRLVNVDIGIRLPEDNIEKNRGQSRQMRKKPRPKKRRIKRQKTQRKRQQLKRTIRRNHPQQKRIVQRQEMNQNLANSLPQ